MFILYFIFQTEELKLYEAYKSRIRTIYQGNDNLGDIEFTDTIVVCQVATSDDEQLKTIGRCNFCFIILHILKDSISAPIDRQSRSSAIRAAFSMGTSVKLAKMAQRKPSRLFAAPSVFLFGQFLS